ncbi:hypothetical protein WUBG_12957 [Wuchereria bancrofti]|uniref:Uncharacterized protein n=1 Tax=Wuchereria bancrofti TaxID=6293 RepID=J9EGL0_WUCBA|nr:hypothetical protein WUBG_12957 [Wuchereria bancrofti]VDM14568.1 unnamed protein product [Wuchereria bancrofti]
MKAVNQLTSTQQLTSQLRFDSLSPESVSDVALPNANQQGVSSAAPSVGLADSLTVSSVAAPIEATFPSLLSSSAIFSPGWGDVSAAHVSLANTTVQSPLQNTVLLAAATPLVR